MSFISYLINGISLGSVYALIALGYTMVYGIAKMLNFAHGDVIMVGAFITYTMCSTMGLSPVIGVLAAVIACTLLGMAIEKVAYKPLRKASSPLAVLITAIGVSYLLQNVALLIFGANAKAFTSVVSVPAVKLADGQINITGETIVTILSCLVIMAGLMFFINKTKAGQAMLAVSEDKGAAQLMGINVDGTIALTFAIGSGLAAVAGVIAPLFVPVGFGDWRISTALITGFMAKESVVSTLGVLFNGNITAAITPLAASSLLVFSLLYSPCVAAIASVKRELGTRWAVGLAVWQCIIAWIAALIIRLIGVAIGFM